MTTEESKTTHDECVETDEELLARFYDHTDDRYSLAARARKDEAVDSGNHDYI